jgi:hypothetical protein
MPSGTSCPPTSREGTGLGGRRGVGGEWSGSPIESGYQHGSQSETPSCPLYPEDSTEPALNTAERDAAISSVRNLSARLAIVLVVAALPRSNAPVIPTGFVGHGG